MAHSDDTATDYSSQMTLDATDWIMDVAEASNAMICHQPIPKGNSILSPEQPVPIKNNNPDISPLVMADFLARAATGLSRYGVPLQANNGRDALRDLYDELLDACQYIRQVMFARDGK